MSSPWYLLKCPSCRAEMRIKSEYSHMRGKCPVCKQWIESLLPKPLSFSDDAVVADEEWPEPPELLSTPDQDQSTSYALRSVSEPARTPQLAQEEDTGGVYNLAFEPDLPKGAGISRSAEWDQGSTPATTTSSTSTKVQTPVPVVKATPPPVIEAYQTVIDPLFGDEIKVAVTPPPAPAATPLAAPTKTAPMAKVADPLAPLHSPSAVPQLEEPIPLPPEPPATVTKKKKRKKAEDTAPPEDFSHLNKPTEDTHLYQLSDAEINRIKSDAPPKLLFVDGVLNFPWTGSNVFPWIWLSLGFVVINLLMALINHILESGSTFANVGAEALGMASTLIYVFTLSYGCACWSNTINFTAAGSRAVDWSTEGWKENVVQLLHVGYYFVLAMMMASPLLILNFIGIGWILWLMGTLFLFPIFFFSGLASLTFWNFLHPEIIKKTIAKLHYYLTMYGIGLALFAVTGVVSYYAMQYSMLAFVAGPIAAAAWLIYGRLLGRMAYLLQQEPPRKKKKKKKKKPVEAGFESDQETTVEPDNEKGPREDARGPGGARPV